MRVELSSCRVGRCRISDVLTGLWGKGQKQQLLKDCCSTWQTFLIVQKLICGRREKQQQKQQQAGRTLVVLEETRVSLGLLSWLMLGVKSWVTLRVPECPHHVHLSTKTFRWLCLALVGPISLWTENDKRSKIRYFQILTEGEEEGSGKLKTSLNFAAILENLNHCSAPCILRQCFAAWTCLLL